jgi:hypothetical protein
MTRQSNQHENPFDDNHVGFGVVQGAYHFLEEMVDDTATEFDVYVRAKVEGEALYNDQTLSEEMIEKMALVLGEAGEFAKFKQNLSNDD